MVAVDRGSRGGPAEVVLVALDDLALDPVPHNVPGTSDERPNWQRRVSGWAESLDPSRGFAGRGRRRLRPSSRRAATARITGCATSLAALLVSSTAFAATAPPGRRSTTPRVDVEVGTTVEHRSAITAIAGSATTRRS